MTLSDRLQGAPPHGQPRICNDPAGCRRQTVAPDQARCDDHRERWQPEWLARRRSTPQGLSKDLTEGAAL